jgi:hypothetical protein
MEPETARIEKFEDLSLIEMAKALKEEAMLLKAETKQAPKYYATVSAPHPYLWGVYHYPGTIWQPYSEHFSIKEAQDEADECNLKIYGEKR